MLYGAINDSVVDIYGDIKSFMTIFSHISPPGDSIEYIQVCYLTREDYGKKEIDIVKADACF